MKESVRCVAGYNNERMVIITINKRDTTLCHNDWEELEHGDAFKYLASARRAGHVTGNSDPSRH